jgi:indole-3-glycerol phosphate synthase
MNDFLRQVVQRTEARLAEEPIEVEDVRVAARQAFSRRQPFAFSTALRGEGLRVIAEIKAASPSAGWIVRDPDVAAIAAEYKRGGATAISIVTEPDFFHGNRDWIRRAAEATGLPVIMKDFVIEPSQLMSGIAAGASAILLLAALLDATEIRRFIQLLDEYGCDALVEVHDEKELRRALDGGARLIGVNNRDLRTFNVDLATAERLAPMIPRELVRVAESGIKTGDDVQRLHRAGFNAFLVGESLLRQADRAKAVEELVATWVVEKRS